MYYYEEVRNYINNYCGEIISVLLKYSQFLNWNPVSHMSNIKYIQMERGDIVDEHGGHIFWLFSKNLQSFVSIDMFYKTWILNEKHVVNGTDDKGSWFYMKKKNAKFCWKASNRPCAFANCMLHENFPR